jgi:hypothetical protein
MNAFKTSEWLFGRIIEIREDVLLRAGIGPAPYELIVSFTPRVLAGFEGQSLERLGIKIGTPVRLRRDRTTDRIEEAALQV